MTAPSRPQTEYRQAQRAQNPPAPGRRSPRHGRSVVHCRSPSPAPPKPAPDSATDAIRPIRYRRPLATTAATRESSTSGRSAFQLARSLHHLLFGADQMAFQHVTSYRHEDAVAHEAQDGEADDASKHDVEAHPFLSEANQVGESRLRTDQFGGKQHDEGMGETDAD